MVLELSASAGVDREIASSLSEAIAIEAGRIGAFEVMTQKDLSTLLGMERQKQLLGCGEESSSCAMELAEAVGSRFVLTGSLVRLGNTWQLNMQTVDSTRAAPLGRATRLASELDTLRAQLPWALAEATATPAPKEPSRALPYGLMIGGGVALVSSAALFLVSFTTEQTAVAELNVMGATLNHNAEYYRLQGEQIAAMRLGGAIAAGVGAAALLVGILINPRSDAVTRVALVPTFSGAALAGSFP
jgi:TolB-like protein